MPTAHNVAEPQPESRLLVPLGAQVPDLASDTAVVNALVLAEVALVRAWAHVGVAPQSVADEVSQQYGWDHESQRRATHSIDADEIARGSALSGTAVIGLAAALKEASTPEVASWIHRGATSQDIIDTALMRVAMDVVSVIIDQLDATCAALDALANTHAHTPVAARTLTQHAVPSTMGLRARQWGLGISRAAVHLRRVLADTPAQLGGAAGTLAAFVDVAQAAGADRARATSIAQQLPAAFAEQMGLRPPGAPWHTQRWPVTELGDALVQATDALGKFSSDVTMLMRTEVGELRDTQAGGSSAMPHKRNPVDPVLVKSAAIRAPHLGATLHSCAALAVDERPDGAWHAEWPTLQELLRLTLAASARAAQFASRLEVDTERAAANLALTGPAILSERLTIALTPLLGAHAAAQAIAQATDIAELREHLLANSELANIDIDNLLDTAAATGLASDLARTAGDT